MIFTSAGKKIRVMFTPFRDGLQSSFGGKVRLHDFLDAMKASVDIGVRHFEFGGGARYQAPYFYLGEDPFEDMKTIREAVGSMAKCRNIDPKYPKSARDGRAPSRYGRASRIAPRCASASR